MQVLVIAKGLGLPHVSPLIDRKLNDECYLQGRTHRHHADILAAADIPIGLILGRTLPTPVDLARRHTSQTLASIS
jgi:hypothetical protein